MKLVLDCGEKLFGNGCLFIIICREGIDICNFLVKPPFTRPDFTNALQQFIEIILAEYLITLFEPFIVQNKTLDKPSKMGIFGGDWYIPMYL